MVGSESQEIKRPSVQALCPVFCPFFCAGFTDLRKNIFSYNFVGSSVKDVQILIA